MDKALAILLSSFNCVMVEFKNKTDYIGVHTAEEWSSQLFVPQQNNIFTINEQSYFLADFIHLAFDFWRDQKQATLPSGIWTESHIDGSQLHFEAEAINADGKHFLLIKNIAEQFNQRQQTLQTAREMSLSHNDLLTHHQYTQERIESVIAKQTNAQLLTQSITKAVSALETGIVITNKNLNCVFENPAIFDLFELNCNYQGGQALRQLLNLLDKQYPEFEHTLYNHEAWQGELCWMAPPFNMKWFMLSLLPVKDNDEQLLHWVFLVTDISRVKYLQQHNEKLTLIDHLTELPNRQYFWNTVTSLINQHSFFYILYIDIKNFKLINEEFGHAIGDEVLKLIAEQIQPLIKKEDMIARISGDEFALVLPSVSQQEHCRKVVDRINLLLLTPYLHKQIKNLNLSLFIGASCYPTDGKSTEQLMKSANIAVKYAKSLQGVNFAFYSKALEEESLNRQKLKNELADAIEQEQFELHFQPIYEASIQSIAKVEVLIRWNHPKLGIVMPDKFIPLAEETGLIIPLGKWVFKQACFTLEQLKFRGHHIDIAVNLSPRQFNDLTLSEYIEKTINTFNITAHNIELEVTEGLLINNFDSVLMQLDALRKVGIGLSVDDFGTGYSSLLYLKRLPINTLKIDRSFVKDLARDNNDMAIVSAVIAMAHKLNLQVVAEGVEEGNQLSYLLDNKCDFIQGFLLSKPIPFTALCDMLDLKQAPNFPH